MEENCVDGSHPRLSFGGYGGRGYLFDTLKAQTDLTSREPVIPVEYRSQMRACVAHATVEEAL